MNSARRMFLSAGAVLSFITLFILFGLIFYELFIVPAKQQQHNTQQDAAVFTRHAKTITTHFAKKPPPAFAASNISSSSSTPMPLTVNGTDQQQSSFSSSSQHSYGGFPDSLSNWAGFKRIWTTGNERDRAHLLVRNVNMNVNSTWSAKVNKYTIGLKPLSEMVNFTDNFDPLNSTFMMDPERLKRIELYLEKAFFPLYDRHILELQVRQEHIPDRFNAAQRWGHCAQSILRVRDQGGCGSCWALAAISVMSDRICIASNGRYRDGLSAQQLVECCNYCGGCTGAPNSFFPFLYWHQQGVVTDQCFPYTIARDCGYPCPPSEFQHPRGLGNCTHGGQQCANPAQKPRRHKARYVYKLGSLDENEPAIHYFPLSLMHRMKKLNATGNYFANGHGWDTVELLKRELLAHGPVMLCFSVFESFMHYHDGVYNFDLQPGELHVYDHCAKVIGWGRQRRPNAVGMQQYLIAVNSWSAMWAKDGTFKVDLDRLAHFHSDLFAGVPQL